MSLYRIEFESLEWETPIEGVRCKIIRRDNTQLRLVEYTPAMEPHQCDRGHVGYILDGRFEIRFDHEVSVFEPGDGVFIPSGQEHRHIGKALTDVVRVIFVEPC